MNFSKSHNQFFFSHNEQGHCEFMVCQKKSEMRRLLLSLLPRKRTMDFSTCGILALLRSRGKFDLVCDAKKEQENERIHKRQDAWGVTGQLDQRSAAMCKQYPASEYGVLIAWQGRLLGSLGSLVYSTSKMRKKNE